MIADAERQLLDDAPALGDKCAVMRLDQRAGGDEERGAVGGQPYRARRAFDQPLAQGALQPLQLHADRGLGVAERFGGAGEAFQFGDQQEGLHGRDIQRGMSSPILIIDIRMR